VFPLQSLDQLQSLRCREHPFDHENTSFGRALSLIQSERPMEVLFESLHFLLRGWLSPCFALVLLAGRRCCRAAAFTGRGLIGLIGNGDRIAFALRAWRAYACAGVGLGRIGIGRLRDAKAQGKKGC
jgi:hypothetical protein